MKYEFIVKHVYDTVSGRYRIDVPKGYKPFTITRWPVPGQAIEFWFIRDEKAVKGEPCKRGY